MSTQPAPPTASKRSELHERLDVLLTAQDRSTAANIDARACGTKADYMKAHKRAKELTDARNAFLNWFEGLR